MEIKEIIATVILVVLMLFLFYITNWQQKRKAKEVKKMQEELKEGDNIVTFGGLSGKIVAVDDDQIIVELRPDKTRVSIEKWAVSYIDYRDIYGDKKEDNHANDEEKDN